MGWVSIRLVSCWLLALLLAGFGSTIGGDEVAAEVELAEIPLSASLARAADGADEAEVSEP